jgi:hypothetical protein
LRFDEVVIGRGLNALVYAYCNDATLIRTSEAGPPPFDFFEPALDLSLLLFPRTTYELKTNVGTITVGIPKLDLWDRLSYIMSMAGQLPFSNKVKSVRVSPEQKTISVVAGNTSTTLEYNKLRVFDTFQLYGLESHILNDFEKEQSANFLPPKKFKILDWFNVRSGCKHEFDYFCTDDDFVKEIYFYPTERMDGRHNLKDLVAISYLTKAQLSDVEYSDTYARFKILALMKENGIRGSRNGRDQKYPGKYKYYAVRIEATIRDMLELEKNIFSAFPAEKDIIFDNRPVEDIIISMRPEKSYTHQLHERLCF